MNMQTVFDSRVAQIVLSRLSSLDLRVLTCTSALSLAVGVAVGRLARPRCKQEATPCKLRLTPAERPLLLLNVLIPSTLLPASLRHDDGTTVLCDLTLASGMVAAVAAAGSASAQLAPSLDLRGSVLASSAVAMRALPDSDAKRSASRTRRSLISRLSPPPPAPHLAARLSPPAPPGSPPPLPSPPASPREPPRQVRESPLRLRPLRQPYAYIPFDPRLSPPPPEPPPPATPSPSTRSSGSEGSATTRHLKPVAGGASSTGTVGSAGGREGHLHLRVRGRGLEAELEAEPEAPLLGRTELCVLLV